jgi:long-chain fatty acid transport protein
LNKLIKLTFFYLISSNILASGFQINEHGTKAMSMGGAFTALADDPSAVYFNSAGITQSKGFRILAGTTLIMPNSSFRGPLPSIDEYKMEPQLFTPVHLYATYQFNEKLFFGFGIGNNYGLGTEWDKDWIGKYLAVQTELRTFFLNLQAAMQIIPEISVGFGYALVYGDVLIGRSTNLSPFNANAYLELEGSGIGSGFTAGLLIHPSKAISLGLSYRSQVTIEFKGDASPKEYPEQFEGLIPNGAISAPLTTPENITVGVALKPFENFTLTADYQYVGWDSYDKLQIEFKEFTNSETGEDLVSVSERNYENSFIARLGINYRVNASLDVSAGFLLDKNPVKDEYIDPTLPDADRIGLSGGIGYMINKKLKLELGYLFLRFEERKISNSLQDYSGIEGSGSPFNGVYNSHANLISLTFNYNI